jgi:hypothetical protein
MWQACDHPGGSLERVVGFLRLVAALSFILIVALSMLKPEPNRFGTPSDCVPYLLGFFSIRLAKNKSARFSIYFLFGHAESVCA